MTVENILNILDDCYITIIDDVSYQEVLSSKDNSITNKEYNDKLNTYLNKKVVAIHPNDEYEMIIYIKM